MIQYCEAPVMESNGHGVLDTPLSRSMTTSCRAALCATHPAVVPASGDDIEIVLNPEIRRLHLLVISQFRAGAVHDHVAAFQHIGALHQRQRAADVLLDQQNGGA